MTSKTATPRMEDEIANIRRCFPVLDRVKQLLAGRGFLEGASVGWHCHLTRLTAMGVEVLLSSGAAVHLSECNRDTSEADAVEYMQRQGAAVHVGPDSPAAVLAARPNVISDTGLVLLSHYLDSPSFPLAGACEITTSGVARLRALQSLPLPVVNINDGQLKTLIENFHGVGDGLVDALTRMLGVMWSGRRVAVAGYGRVGAGVASRLKGAGAVVSVVETDPVRALVAHYDGFALATLEQALTGSELLVTATGHEGLLGEEQWRQARDGLYVVNVGHWPEEVGAQALRSIAAGSRAVSEHLEEFEIARENGRKRVYLTAAGSPINVVMVSGSPEPTLIHLATELLSLEFLVRKQKEGVLLPAGETAVPADVERLAAAAALEALGLSPAVAGASVQAR